MISKFYSKLENPCPYFLSITEELDTLLMTTTEQTIQQQCGSSNIYGTNCLHLIAFRQLCLFLKSTYLKSKTGKETSKCWWKHKKERKKTRKREKKNR